MKYKVRLIYPSGTVRDVFHTDNRDEAEGYIIASKELRPRVRHQLGFIPDREYSFICTREMMNQ